MATHGHIVVKGEGDQLVNLYAWHDGCAFQALGELLKLPEILFNIAKCASLDEEHPLSSPVRALWFYSSVMQAAIERPKSYASKSDLSQYWREIRPFDLEVISLANWMTQIRFGVWHVVPDVSYCTYPRPGGDIQVECRDRDFLVSVNCGEADVRDFSRFGEMREMVTRSDFVAKSGVNSHKFERDAFLVPFDDTLIDLLWQDVCEARNILSNGGAGSEGDKLATAVCRYKKLLRR